jgi:hypothetical protein
MKNIPHYFKTLSVIAGVIFILSACKKDPVTTCCTGIPPENKWLLTTIQFRYFYGFGRYIATRHLFEYNKFNKPLVHKEIEDLLNPAHLFIRIDSFYYNSKQQLTRIISADQYAAYHPSTSYKETFSYDGSDRKKYSLKYLLSATTNQYQLNDSTAYQYVDSTIWKLTYHLTKGKTDTAFFTYNQQKNIVRFKMGEYGSGIQELSLYDQQATPVNYAGVDAFELDPYPSAYNWGVEFLLLMQAPQVSRNNYMRRQAAGIEDINYTVNYSMIDSIVGTISSHLIEEDAEFSQSYIYTPIN